MLGALNTNEKKAIKKLEKILFKYQKNSGKWLHNIFYVYDNEQKIWNWIKKNYTKEEFNDLKEVFNVTQGKFDKLWQKIDVQQVKDFCERLKRDYNQGMFSDISKFIGFKNSDKLIINIAVCPIVLGMGIAGHAWGNKDAIINIEFSMTDIKENNILEIALLLSHEIFHIVFSRAKCFRIFKEEITKNGIDKIMENSLILADFYDRPFVLVEEAIVMTFSDMFYQRIKYSRAKRLLYLITKLLDKNGESVIKKQIIKGKRIGRDDVLIYLGYKVFPVALDYIYKNKPIDRDLIRLFALNVKELLSWEKRYKNK